MKALSSVLRLHLGMLGVLAVLSPLNAIAKGGPGADRVTTTNPNLFDQQDFIATLQDLLQGSVCPTPSVQDCNNLDYRVSECGRRELSRALGLTSRGGPSACEVACLEITRTNDECRDQRWFNSICGLLERQRMSFDGTYSATTAVAPTGAAECTNDLMTEASSTELGFTGLSFIDLIIPPLNCFICSNEAGQESTARQGVFSRDDQQIIPLQTFYQGHNAQTFTELSKTPGGAAVYQAIHNAWRNEWEANSNQLGGTGPSRLSHACYEYIYEKYYDWGRFTDASAPLGDDFRGVYNVAYAITPDLARSNIGSRGLGDIPLQQRNFTTTVPGFSFPRDQPKNIFFGPDYGTAIVNEPDPVVDFAGAYLKIRLRDPVFAPLMLQLREDAAPFIHFESWQYHQQQGQALLPQYLDHHFQRFDDMVERFRFLLDQRAKLAIGIHEYLDGRFNHFPDLVARTEIFDPSIHFDELIEQLAHFDETARTLEATRAYREDISRRSNPAALRGVLALPGLDPGLTDLEGATTYASIYTPGGPGAGARTPAAAGALNSGVASIIPYSTFNAWLLALDDVEGLSITEMTQLANAADILIEAALMEAYDAGCLDLSGRTPCDWSPRRFKDSLNDPYTAQREVDFQRCLDVVGGQDLDFANLRTEFYHPPYGGCSQFTPPGESSPVCQTTIGGQPCSPPFNTNPDQLEFYMECRDKWLLDIRRGIEEQVGESIIDENGNLRIGKMSSDATDIGGDMFGVGFSFEGGWGIRTNSIPNLGEGAPAPNFCGLDPYIVGTAQAGAKVFYKDVSLIDAVVDVELQDADNEIHLQILDEVIYQESGESLQFTVDAQPKANQAIEKGDRIDETFFSYGTTVLVVWVPVSLEAGLRGFIGLRGGAAANVDGCGAGNLSLSAHLTPYAGVEGYAEASIDALVVEAGVTGVLRVVRVDLPLVAGLTFAGQTGPGGRPDARMSVTTSLDLVMTLLSGYFAAFVEVCYIFDCERAEAKIFSWEGPKLTTNLFESAFSVGLIPLHEIREGL